MATASAALALATLPEPWASIQAVPFDQAKQCLPDAEAQIKFKQPPHVVNPLAKQWQCIQWISTQPKDLAIIRQLSVATKPEEIRSITASPLLHVSLWLDEDGHVQVLVPRIDPATGEIDCKVLAHLNKFKQKHVFKANSVGAVRDAWQKQNVCIRSDGKRMPMLPTALLIDGKAMPDAFKKPAAAGGAATAPSAGGADGEDDDKASAAAAAASSGVKATGAAALPNASTQRAAVPVAVVDQEAERMELYNDLLRQQIEYFNGISSELGALAAQMEKGGAGDETFTPRGVFAAKRVRDESAFLYQLPADAAPGTAEHDVVNATTTRTVRHHVTIEPGAYEPNIFALINSIIYEPPASSKSRSASAAAKRTSAAQKRTFDSVTKAAPQSPQPVIAAAAAAETNNSDLAASSTAAAAATTAATTPEPIVEIFHFEIDATDEVVGMSKPSTSRTAAAASAAPTSSSNGVMHPTTKHADKKQCIRSAAELAKQCVSDMPLLSTGMLSEQFAKDTLDSHANGRFTSEHLSAGVVAGRLLADLAESQERTANVAPLVKTLISGSGTFADGGEFASKCADVRLVDIARKVYPVNKWTVLLKQCVVPLCASGMSAFFRAKGAELVERQLSAALEPFVQEAAQCAEREEHSRKALADAEWALASAQRMNDELKAQLAAANEQIAKLSKGPSAEEFLAQEEAPP